MGMNDCAPPPRSSDNNSNNVKKPNTSCQCGVAEWKFAQKQGSSKEATVKEVSHNNTKMDLDRATIGLGLKVLSTATAGLFAGGALYINLVEHPARMESPDMPTAVTAWKPSFVRAAKIWSKFAMTSSLSSVAAYFVTREADKGNIGWLVSGGMMFGIPVLTMIMIIPINNQLLETEKCIKENGDEWIEENLTAWNNRHFYRTLLGLGAFTGMIVMLAKGKN